MTDRQVICIMAAILRASPDAALKMRDSALDAVTLYQMVNDMLITSLAEAAKEEKPYEPLR